MCNFWVAFWQTHFVPKGNKDSTNEIYVTVTNSLSMNPNSTIQKWFVLAINTFITSFSSFDVWFGIPKHFSSQHDNPSSLSLRIQFSSIAILILFLRQRKTFNLIFFSFHLYLQWNEVDAYDDAVAIFSHYLSNCNL